MLLTAATGADARAIPNPRCAGTCSDGVTACGSAADCGGLACTFPDACLPGFAGLIQAVLAEAPGGVDDPSAWSCGFVKCRVVDGALRFSCDLGITAIAVKDLVLAAGHRYLVRAEMRADADTFGYFDVAGDDIGALSPEVVGPSEWQPVAAMFEVPPGGPAMTLQLRLHADGPGELGLRDVVVYVLGDYGVWLRMTVVSPERATTFRAGAILRHAGGGPGYYPQACADAPADDCVDRALTQVTAEAGEASPWIEISAAFAGGDRATWTWDLIDPARETPLGDDVTVRVEVAWRADESAIFWSDTRAPGAPHIGLYLPEGVPPPDRLRANIGWIGDLVRADRATLTPASARPHDYVIGTIVNSIDLFARWAPLADDALGLLADLGLNAAAYMTDRPDASDRAAALAHGLDHAFVHAETLMAPWDWFIEDANDFDLDLLADQVRANVSEPYWIDLSAATSDPSRVFAITGDESAGLFFAGPKYRAAFHAWLAEHAPEAGLTPASFGVASFDQIEPLENMGWWLVPERRPDTSDAPAARRFVWALRFWNVATAQAYATALSTWRDVSGVAWRAAFNAGTPIAGRYFQYALGSELQTMLGEHAVTAFFGEGFLSYLDDCFAWDLGYYADWVAGQLEPWRGSTDFPVASYLHAYRGDQGRKMLELVTRGFTWFNHYSYGPYDVSTGDGAGGFGAGSGPWLDRVARGSELIAKVEPALLDTRRAASPIVMLGTWSDPVWTDTSAASDDELGWHLALSQAHFQVDIMPESEIEAGRLEGPGAPRRILFALRKHVSNAAMQAIQRWVDAGGTLVIGPELVAYDEYDQLDGARATWLAVAAGSPHSGSERVTLQWATRDGLTSFDYPGTWRELLGVGATTVAVAADGHPVVVRVPRGRGRVFALGVSIGEAFRAPVFGCGSRPAGLPPRYPDQFSAAMRGAMTSLLATLDLDQSRVVWADDPRLSLQSVSGPRGPAVVAVAWASEPIDVALSAPAWRGCQFVHEWIDNYDVPVIFGNLLMRIDRAAVLTWDPSACERPVVVEPVADDRAEDVPVVTAADGCSGADATWPGLGLALAALFFSSCAPRSRRRSSCASARR